MDISLLLHQSDSRFCYALDDKHVLIRLAVSKLVSLSKVQLVVGDPMTFHNKHQYFPMKLMHVDQAYNYYEINLEVNPIRLMYVFYLVENNNEYYFYDFGLSNRYIFDLAFISAFQFVGENYNDYFIENKAWKGRIFYQIFVDRFAKSNLLDKSYVNTDWNNENLANNRGAFLGGDLYGVIDKLPYLKDLGISAVYLTPIHPSDSNHKYDVKDYFDVDPHFGGLVALEKLVYKAHELDIMIMLDLVFNHVSVNHPFFIDVMNNGRNSKYYDWFFINGDKPSKSPLNYKCFGYFPFMPKLNTNNIEVQSYLIDVAKFWMNKYQIDGFRLDVSEGVSHDFWIRLKIALKTINRDILLIGENWFNAESYLGPDQLDGIMNYPFLSVVSGYVKKSVSLTDTIYKLENLLMRYKDGSNKMMMNILASHDIERFSNLTNRNYNLNLIGYAIMMFYVGYPLIYYGEEIFMDGGRDPDNRRGMKWDSPNYRIKEYEIFKSLIRLRHEDVMIDGELIVSQEQDCLVMKRKVNNLAYVLIVNLSGVNQKCSGNVILSNRYNGFEIQEEGFVIKKSFE